MNTFIQNYDKVGGKMVMQGLIPFMELKDAVIFTNRTNPNRRDKKKLDIAQESYNYYQRRIDNTRIKSIVDFIDYSLDEELEGNMLSTLFPTSMILAIDYDPDESENETSNKLKLLDGDMCSLDIRSNAFIVDGQHRMFAMLRYYKELCQKAENRNDDTLKKKIEIIEKYKFNCTILVNYDLWEQGQVFINVNFKQKPVNKSLYYEVFGSEYRENKSDWKRNKIYLAHMMTKDLNDNKESPYHNKVKMIGTGDGYISQAFVVESLLPNIGPYELWIYDPYATEFDEREVNYFSTELISFFVAVKRVFSEYWPVGKETKGKIIHKTTAFGAFVRLMAVMREIDDQQLISELKRSAQKGELCEDYINRVTACLKLLKPNAGKLFGENTEFANSSGKGAESKLYRKMLYYMNTTEEDLAAVASSLSPELDADDVSMELQEYMWTEEISDIAELGHHYEVEEISQLSISNCKKNGSNYVVDCKFEVSVILYMDNEDDSGFSMSFPVTCTAEFKHDKDRVVLNKENIKLYVDTSAY